MGCGGRKNLVVAGCWSGADNGQNVGCLLIVVEVLVVF